MVQALRDSLSPSLRLSLLEFHCYPQHHQPSSISNKPSAQVQLQHAWHALSLTPPPCPSTAEFGLQLRQRPVLRADKGEKGGAEKISYVCEFIIKHFNGRYCSSQMPGSASASETPREAEKEREGRGERDAGSACVCVCVRAFIE